MTSWAEYIYIQFSKSYLLTYVLGSAFKSQVDTLTFPSAIWRSVTKNRKSRIYYTSGYAGGFENFVRVYQTLKKPVFIIFQLIRVAVIMKSE